MSELVTHASAEKCGDLLKARKPSQGALHKGATLIIMVLFFLKHSTNLLWLGTSTTPETSGRGKKRAAAASDVDSDDAPSDDEKAHPITADVAMELKKLFSSAGAKHIRTLAFTTKAVKISKRHHARDNTKG